MNHNLTHIHMLIDRSGSMQRGREDHEGGINSFIAGQKDAEGESLFTIVQFDTVVEPVCTDTPVKQVPHFNLIPRGGTALLDAIGTTVGKAREKILKLPEQDRPNLMIFVIVTDGGEADSREHSKATVKKLIEDQETLGWKFVFLGANQDAFAEAGGIGISRGTTANFKTQNASKAYEFTGDMVKTMRANSVRGLHPTQISACYSTEQLKELDEEP